jgi:4a-hydroxytetrahydrobiopterin dehydratase
MPEARESVDERSEKYGRRVQRPNCGYCRNMGGMSTDEIAQALEGFTGWAYDGDALIKTFTFDGFAAAIEFMATAAPSIDELNHHPEWTNVYNRVDVRLNSHDVGGVTDRDFKLASLLDELASRA